MTVSEMSGMNMTERAHPVEGGADELETVARRLHGKPYRLLSDAEATAVWDEIERQAAEL